MRIIISGGGTGGHIFPAIAVADEMKKRNPNCKILFVGAKGRMEMEKVPKAGYKIKGLWITGIQRKLSLKNLIFPLKLIFSLVKSYFIINKFKPDIVIGTGGFASGALLYVASKKGIKTVIQEQNSYAGITNKLLGKSVDKILISYKEAEKYFPKGKTIITGNPIRKSLFDKVEKKQALDYFDLKGRKKILLILGGSLGAKKINEIFLKNIDNILEDENIQILWQCGKVYYKEYSKKVNDERIKLFAFLDNMNFAYGCADLVVSRAGAIAISEITSLGKPSILVPSPNVAEDHQTKNAKVLYKNKASILIKEEALDKKFNTIIKTLKDNSKLKELSINAIKISTPNALEDIISEIENI